MGTGHIQRLPSNDRDELDASALEQALAVDPSAPTIVLLQAGEINLGAYDDFTTLIPLAHRYDAWVHVDGAFGLWAAASPRYRHLMRGCEAADSWATDGHKWLNVTYDCGLAFVRHVEDLRRTFTAAAGYLPGTDRFESMHHTPQSSQRARQVEVWAVLRTLGRRGVAELVARSCRAARTIADRLAAGGLSVLNDVVLNQVLVRMDDGPTTDALIAAVQADGRIWCGPTVWAGASAMRISVSSWKTGAAESALAADVILECAGRVRTPRPR
jgi:glutamate/tyrosine decarboxylase-like PLP-dependent enzyme